MESIKILILTNAVPTYRVPLFEKISDKHETKIAVYSNSSFSKINNLHIDYFKIKKMGNFIVVERSLFNYIKNFDVIINDFNFHVPQLYFLFLFSKIYNFKLINWGIGVSASYNKRFDSDKKYDFIRFKLFSLAKACVFYSDYARQRYIKYGVNRNKLFVANNSVQVKNNSFSKAQDYFIFVGTLYKEKKIIHLLNCYLACHKINSNIKPLVIIGDGDEYSNIKIFIKNNNLENNISLKGAIYDESSLAVLIKNAVAMISPNQAGLSVLLSFGYGIPFICNNNAITGGERLNIINEFNGYLYDTNEELMNIILNLNSNYSLVELLSKNAYNYYNSKASMELMVAEFLNAIKYSVNDFK